MEDMNVKPFKDVQPGDSVYCIDIAKSVLLTLKVKKTLSESVISPFFHVEFEDPYEMICDSNVYYDLSKPVYVSDCKVYSTSKLALQEFLSTAAHLLD